MPKLSESIVINPETINKMVVDKELSPEQARQLYQRFQIEAANERTRAQNIRQYLSFLSKTDPTLAAKLFPVLLGLDTTPMLEA